MNKQYDKAWKLLENKGWCKYAYAKNINGLSVQPQDEDACEFCTEGVLFCIYGYGNMKFNEAYSKLINRINRDRKNTCVITVTEWNDLPGRTKEEVINVLKELDI